jgi:glucose/arabinose dehydrogenase
MAVEPATGRVFVTEQATGNLRVVGADGALRPTPFVTVPARDDGGERGLLGVALDPAFKSNGYVYVYWTNPQPRQHDVISRFTADPANPDQALPNSQLDIYQSPIMAAGNHLGGAMHFGLDGKLYLAVGEHGSPDFAQDLSMPFGKMLRFNPDGSTPEDNPFVGQAGEYGDKVWAYGLRNPFTFNIDPETGRMHINDVGSNQREEVNLGEKGANYGWPLTEGKFDPEKYPGFTNPLFDYVRSLDGCAITGGTFYRAPDGAERPWPAEYDGKYFYADYCRTYVQSLDPSNNYATASPFAQDLPQGPVDLDVGPAGDVFVLCRGAESNGTGSIVRIAYTASNVPSIGTQPRDLTVSVGQPATFSVAASGTAPLTYQWQRRDAGAAGFSDIPGANSASYTLDSTSVVDDGAQFRAVVRNTAGAATSNPATLTVTTSRPPAATIDSPPGGSLYRAGETINFSGTGTDPEDGVLPATAYTWSVVFHHATHTHPFLAPFSGATSGSFTIPTIGEADSDVWYRINLTVTDSAGLSTSVFRDVHPHTAQVTLAASVPGLALTLDGTPHPAPYVFTGVTGFGRTVSAPATQTVNGVGYEFVSWSDGGAAEHVISTPEGDTTYTAVYRVAPRVVGRYAFYNRSAFDANDPAPGAADDGAIATDKSALLPGQTATFANYTSYVRGINGVMIDVLNGGDSIGVADFAFSVGRSADTSAWAAAPAPARVDRRPGAGAGGSDRVTITWPDRAIRNQWLRVVYQPRGSSARDVFYFGNAIGETGNSPLNAVVNSLDVAGIKAHRVAARTAAIDNRYDVNRDRRVNALDLAVVRRGFATPEHALPLIAVPGTAAVAMNASTVTFSATAILSGPARALGAF